jgi:hypothetical protein
VRARYVLVFCLLFAGSTGAAQHPFHRGFKPSPPLQSHAPADPWQNHFPTDDAPFPVRVIPSPADSANRAAQEARTDKYQAANLQSQMRQADASESEARAAWIALVAAIIAGVLLLWTLYETRRTAKASAIAAAAAENSANAAIAAQRAWLAAAVTPASPLTFADNVCQLSIKIACSNKGHSPATNLRFAMALQAHELGSDAFKVDLLAEVRRKASFETYAPIKFVVFPGEEVTGSVAIGTAIAAGDSTEPGVGLARKKMLKPDHVALMLAICIDYEFSGGQGRTEFVCAVSDLSTQQGIHLDAARAPRDVRIQKINDLQQAT